jgi:hypothetical protein
VRIVISVNGGGGVGLASGLFQSLLESGIDLTDKMMPLDEIETGDNTHVHGGDDQSGNSGDAHRVTDIRPAPYRITRHAGTIR